jgi:hypothetical protein
MDANFLARAKEARPEKLSIGLFGTDLWIEETG